MPEWIEKIKKNNLFKFAKPAEDTVIQETESTLSVKFSPDYIDFLRNIGACICLGHEINGLTDSSILNVITETDEHKSHNPRIPVSFYAIEDTHMDGIIIWQDYSGSVFQAGPNDSPQIIAKDLKQYLGIQ